LIRRSQNDASRRATALVVLVLATGAAAGLLLGSVAAGFLSFPARSSEPSGSSPPPPLGKPRFAAAQTAYTTAVRAGSTVVGVVSPPGGPVDVVVIPATGLSLPQSAIAITVSERGRISQPQIRACGSWCYEFSAAVLEGTKVTISVELRGNDAGRVSLELPARPRPTAGALYRRAVATMTHLVGVSVVQKLSSGRAPIITNYTVQRPDRVSLTTSSGDRTILFRHTRFDFQQGAWLRCPFTGGRLPSYVWQGATAAQIVSAPPPGRRRLVTLAVFNPSVPAFFTVETTPTGRVSSAQMLAPAHFMHERYQPLTHVAIQAPTHFVSGKKHGAC
jgi:hypothetical protein